MTIRPDSPAVSANLELNRREIAEHRGVLSSTPSYVTIGAHHHCNANCVFCLGGVVPPFDLDLYRRFFEARLLPVLTTATHVGWCGFGELLMHPQILELMDYWDTTLPGQKKAFTTNGTRLNAPLVSKLLAGHYDLMISLHASNSELHRRMTGLDQFASIIDSIRTIAEMTRSSRSTLHINLVFLMTSINAHDLPAFVRLAREIGVTTVSCNYLTIFTPEQVKLSPFLIRERVNDIFDAARQEAQREPAMELSLPPRFGVHPAPGPGIPCWDPWNFFYVETQGSVNPCCYAGGHIGSLHTQTFEELWNGPSYQALRAGFSGGRPHDWCAHCYRRDPSLVNDIRSHITSRPDQRSEVLRFLAAHPGQFGAYRSLVSTDQEQS